jgi:hypothetical protein
MKTKTSRIILITVLILVSCLMGTALFESQTKMAHRLYDDYVLDNRNHYLPCEKLPMESWVREVLDDHQDIVQEIEQIKPGYIGVDIDNITCPGKADLLIWYASHSDREAIEQVLLKEDTFFGIPYRLQNR